MDIFDQILKELEIEQLSFDENNLCSFELQSTDTADSVPLMVCIVRKAEMMSLAISVTTASEIPEQIPADLLQLFGEHAMGPLRDEYGVGIYPDTKQLSVYKQFTLANYRLDQIKQELLSLVEAAEEWEQRLSAVVQTVAVEPVIPTTGPNNNILV